MVTQQVCDIDYEVVSFTTSTSSKHGERWSLFPWRQQWWREMSWGLMCLKSSNSTLLLCDDHLTPSQGADVARLQQHYADVLSPLPGRADLTQHHIEMHPGQWCFHRVLELVLITPNTLQVCVWDGNSSKQVTPTNFRSEPLEKAP